MGSLYFDHNATTPVAPAVADAISVALRDVYGNASSVHRLGQAARQQIETSRKTIADLLHALPAEVVFTSGGTEASNLAIFGMTRDMPRRDTHVITSTVEHPAVLESCRQLEREGAEVTYVSVDRTGLVDIDEIRSKLRPQTVLLSIMHANNETGVIQPVREIAALVRERRSAGQEIYFHSDGVQAFGKIPVDVQELGVDLYSISAHKVYAPKGIGALFVRRETPLRAIQHGGAHERRHRAGTENVPGIVGFARAAELARTYASSEIAELRNHFDDKLLSALDEVEINGAKEARLPNTSNLLFRGVSGEAMLISLDMKGMAVSTGAACSSGSIAPSHVLLAMGRTPEEARSSVRFSFGRGNTIDDVDQLIETVVATVRHLRSGKASEYRLARA